MSAEHKNINTLSSKMATKTVIKKRGKKSIPLPILEPEQPQPEIIFKNTKEKGDAYEIFIKHHLIDSGNYEWVYLWKHVPEAELFESGIMDDWNQSRIVRKAGRSEGLIGDIGTDLLIKAKDGKYSLVQCKHYNDKRALLIEDLGTFYFMMFNYGDYVNGIVFYTCKLSKLLNDHSKKVNSNIKYNLEPFNTARYIELMNTIYKPTENINDSSNTKLTPHDYQLEAIEKLRGKQRTVCQLPCGMGKTLIAIKLSEEYNQVIVITPLKIYCEQNMERFKSQMPSEYSMMIIDSDNDGRNIDKIKKFISDNEKICLFATFKSVDIVNKLISDKVVNNYYVIIDEFHNLSSNDILEDYLEDNLEEELLDEVNQDNEPELEDSEEDTEYDDTEDTEDLDDSDMEEVEEPENNQSEMYKLLHSDARIMFMSATPKLMGSDNDYSEDCDIDEEIFGKIDYKMDMRTAIERGGICDYMVYVPTLSIEKSTGLDKIQEEVDISKYDKELVIKARFIIRGMMNNGSRKCIVYLQTQEECRVMNTILADVGTNYFAIDVNSNYIISDSSREERKAIIKSFTDGEGYNFICNVNILNECIDVPECDSIFIAYPSKSKIRNIQRMCRANRKNKAMADKIARIYIWADEYKDELVDFIGHLKEYDSQFTFDKVKRLNVIGNKTAVMKSSDVVEENKKLDDIVVSVRGIGSWDELLQIAEENIIKNGFKKKYNGTKEDNQITNWINHQYYNFMKNKMIIPERKLKFANFIEKYKVLFKNIFEKWNDKIIIIKEFIKINNRRPSAKKHETLNINESKKAKWIDGQIKNYEFVRGLMTNKDIYDEMTRFLIENKEYFKSYDEIWKDNYKFIFDRFSQNLRLTDTNDKYIVYINNWFARQKYIFNNINKSIDEDKIIKWNRLKKTYPREFITHDKEWLINRQLLLDYSNEHNKLPIKNDKNTQIEINLIKYIERQKQNIRLNRGLVIKNPYIDYWNEFCVKFPELGTAYDDIIKAEWRNNKIECINFMTNENKRPSSESSNTIEAKLGRWLTTQNNNYKQHKFALNNNELYNEYEELLNQFSHINIDSDIYWKYMLKKHRECLLTGKKPNSANGGFEEKLDRWFDNNLKYFKRKQFKMKQNNDGSESEYYILFKNHIDKFYNLLKTLDDNWWDIAKSLEDNYLKHGKKPLKNKLDGIEKKHAQWISTQHNNIKNNKESMTYPDRKEHWLNLRKKYFELLMTGNEECILKLNKCMEYMDINNKKPHKRLEGENGELGLFIDNIKKSYKTGKGLIFKAEVQPTFMKLKNSYEKYIKFSE